MTKSVVLLILIAALVAVVFEDVGRRTVAGLVTETLTITDTYKDRGFATLGVSMDEDGGRRLSRSWHNMP